MSEFVNKYSNLIFKMDRRPEELLLKKNMQVVESHVGKCTLPLLSGKCRREPWWHATSAQLERVWSKHKRRQVCFWSCWTDMPLQNAQSPSCVSGEVHMGSVSPHWPKIHPFQSWFWWSSIATISVGYPTTLWGRPLVNVCGLRDSTS